MNARTAQTDGIRGRHVLVAMLAFFALIIGVNIAFTVLAVRSFPGEDEKRSYLQGLNYNQRLEARAAQAALGWTTTAGLVARGDGVVALVEVRDAHGKAVEGLTVTGRLRRPATTRDDRTLVFRAEGDGVYVADASGLVDGAWAFDGVATRGEQRFEFERRLSWRSPSTR
jgi:nitrogen fixation protein FixH